jgi:hypothetical protein
MPYLSPIALCIVIFVTTIMTATFTCLLMTREVHAESDELRSLHDLKRFKIKSGGPQRYRWESIKAFKTRKAREEARTYNKISRIFDRYLNEAFTRDENCAQRATSSASFFRRALAEIKECKNANIELQARHETLGWTVESIAVVCHRLRNEFLEDD